MPARPPFGEDSLLISCYSSIGYLPLMTDHSFAKYETWQSVALTTSRAGVMDLG